MFLCVEKKEQQRVIEAKIRIRQKEVEEEEERTQKRLESFSSSSTSAVTADTEYGSAAGCVQSFVRRIMCISGFLLPFLSFLLLHNLNHIVFVRRG